MSFRKSVASTLVTQIQVACLNVLYSMFLARYLGPSGRGQYALLTVYHSGLSMLALLGLDQATCYFMARGAPGRRTVFGHSLLYAAGASALAVLVGLAVAFHLPSLLPNAAVTMRLLAVGAAPFEILTLLGLNVLLGSHDIRGYNRVSLVRGLLPVALIPIVVWLRMGLRGAQLADILVWAVAGCLAVKLATRGIGRPDVRPRGAVLREALKYGVPAQAASLVTFVHLRCSLYLVAALSPPSAAGLYAVALGLSEKLGFFTDRVATLLVPRVSSERSAGRGAAEHTALVFRSVVWVLLGGGLVLGVVARPLLVTLYSAAYAEAARTCRILVAGAVCSGAAGILFGYLLGIGAPAVQTAILSGTAVLNISLALWLTPAYGAPGAAWSSAASQSVAVLAALIAFAKTARLSPARTALPRRSDFQTYGRWLASAIGSLPAWRPAFAERIPRTR